MEIKDIRIEDFDYALPDERIARHPLAERDQCKLLVYDKGNISETTFVHIPELLPEGSTLIYNNTRVINARLRFRKAVNTGAVIEIFCLEPILPRDYAQVFQSTQSCRWLCFIGNNKRWKGTDPLSQILTIEGKGEVILQAKRIEAQGNAFIVEFSWEAGVNFADILSAVGEIPIPPYLNRNTEPSDSTDYQTVYSKIDGSVAAPTAGLHFTDEVLRQVSERGITRQELTLHVGAGTFQPVKSDTIGEHQMHTEFISVKAELIRSLIKRFSDPQCKGKVIAVGTTSVRTLESLYYIGVILSHNPNANESELNVPQWYPYDPKNNTLSVCESLQAILDYLERHHIECYMGSTQIMIAPSYTYHIVQGIITNFHQPQSTLLLLVSAFIGGDWKRMYDYALSHDFRFLSYGDSSLLLN